MKTKLCSAFVAAIRQSAANIPTNKCGALPRRRHGALLALALLSTINWQVSSLLAQGTAFTYQGRLNDGGAPANGSYDVQFMLYDASAGGSQAGPVLTNGATAVSNGLFTVTLDFGAGVFTGSNYWLDIAVRTNGAGTFTELSPRQELTPVPYAIFANTSSNLSGTVSAAQLSGTLTNGQLFHSAVTVDAGPGLSGGGKVTLGNTITLTNAGVLSVTGNADITATPVSGAVTLGDTGTSLDVAEYPGQARRQRKFRHHQHHAGRRVESALSGGQPGHHLLWQRASFRTVITMETSSAASAPGICRRAASTIRPMGSRRFTTTPAAPTTRPVGPGRWGTTRSAPTTRPMAWRRCKPTRMAPPTRPVAIRRFIPTRTGRATRPTVVERCHSNVTGSNNTANGGNALFANTDGTNNTANGYQALFSNLYSSDNTANGYEALYSSTSGFQNTATGSQALYANTGGYYNTADGYEALYANTNGAGNTADGYGALFYNGNGNNNTAVGYSALENHVGGGNTAVGSLAFSTQNDVGKAMNNNTAIGASTLVYLTNGDNNTALGWSAMGNYTGSGNTAVGMNAFGGEADVNGYAMNNNTAIGINALDSLVQGNANIALGNGAGHNVGYGTNNIEIGNAGATSDDNTIKLGAQGTQTTTYIAGIWGVTLPGTAGTPVYIDSSGQLGTATSSERFKEDIQSMAGASEAIYGLRPVRFKYKAAIDPKGGPEFGLIAEEVAQADPNLVVRDAQGEIYTVRYEAVNAMLLNEFLKEHRKVEEQSTEIQQLSQSVQELKEMVSRLAPSQTK